MTLYHKIQSVFLRDPATKHRTFLDGQYATPELEYLADLQWDWTEKVDGTNIRVLWDGAGVTFGGRTGDAQLHAGLVTHLREAFTPDNLSAVFGDSSAMLCGEGFGRRFKRGAATTALARASCCST